MKRIICWVALLFLITDATAQKRKKPVDRIPFPAAEYDTLPAINTGESSIKGEAFFVSSWAQVRKAVGTNVYLFRVTSYTRHWFDVSVLGNKNMTAGDDRQKKCNIYTTSNTEGKFEFNHVPAGNYYLFLWFYWDEPQYNVYGHITGTKRFGGLLHKIITVDGTSTYNYVLTNQQ